MLVVDKNEVLLSEFGKAVLHNNSVEFFLRQILDLNIGRLTGAVKKSQAEKEIFHNDTLGGYIEMADECFIILLAVSRALTLRYKQA